MNGRVSTVLLAAVIALGAGACSAGSQSGSSNAEAKANGAAAAAPQGVTPAKGAAPAGASGALTAVAPTDRSIVYTGQLTLRTADVDALLRQATDLATANGGYVEAENSTTGGDQDGGASAKLVLKVPAAQYQSSLDRLAGFGQVLTRQSQAQDVTQQVVDVASRVKSQQASVDRIRALMAQAPSIAEVVSLESELSHREADLESLQSQQQTLSAQAALSTITLEVRTQPRAAAPAPVKKADGFGSSLGHALAGGWHVLAAIGGGLLIGLAATAPFLLVLAPVGWVLLRLWRRRPAPAAAPVLLAAPGGEEE